MAGGHDDGKDQGAKTFDGVGDEQAACNSFNKFTAAAAAAPSGIVSALHVLWHLVLCLRQRVPLQLLSSLLGAMPQLAPAGGCMQQRCRQSSQA